MTTEYISNFRADTDEKGFTTLRTGDRNDAPDSDLIASVWNTDFLPILLNAPALLVLVHQYKNDLRYPLSEDSRQRRIEAIDRVLAEISCRHCDGTGDVHRADGEWLGSCDCGAKPQ